jgi:hypothetical protein
LFNRRRIGHVHLYCEVRTLTDLRKLRHHLTSSTVVEVEDSDPRTFVREANSTGPADAMCSTSHQRCRAVEASTLPGHHGSRFACRHGSRRIAHAALIALGMCLAEQRPAATALEHHYAAQNEQSLFCRTMSLLSRHYEIR